jgi:hypothetical protein
MLKCICINDKKRPSEIPESHWIKTGESYTVNMLRGIKSGKSVVGLVLKEIDLSQVTGKYNSFSIDRFGFKHEDIVKLISLLETSFPVFDIGEIFEKEVLIGSNLDDFGDCVEAEVKFHNLGDL